jgi:hypothetical protein
MVKVAMAGVPLGVDVYSNWFYIMSRDKTGHSCGIWQEERSRNNMPQEVPDI